MRHFRGIDELDWVPDSPITCLVGPGDAGKSTVLEALELVLSPRWNPSFDDSDFSNGDSTTVIEIMATLGGVPDELLLEGKFGLEARGWDVTGKEIHDEP
ncbi:MAG TPA: AAA family ATPase [Candidatus Hydrogenedentes bacterium]|nr:AAA family ATPase [Candidatus Hydrogenedentota bacterium]